MIGLYISQCNANAKLCLSFILHVFYSFLDLYGLGCAEILSIDWVFYHNISNCHFYSYFLGGFLVEDSQL